MLTTLVASLLAAGNVKMAVLAFSASGVDPMVAAEINTMAANVADTVRWTQAFDSAVTSAFVALGLPAGSALVASTDASQHNPTDLSNPRLRYLFRFHHDFLANDIDFKWGNDLFSLALKLKPALSIDAQIEFGLSKDRGF